MNAGRTALEGIRVLDVTQVMAGPFCAMQLCDMGADVIKVEPPGGDSTRRMAGASGNDSAGFNAVNRGKRGIVLDLGTPRGQDAMRRLLPSADILIENYRPGVMRRFGLDYATLAEQYPALIYASISGYGQTGPAASKGGFDLIAQGVSGLMSITGETGRPPVKVGVPLTDLGAALFALAAILAALHYRTRTGLGQHIDTSLVEAGIALSVWESAEYFGRGVPPRAARIGASHDRALPGHPLCRRLHHAGGRDRSPVSASLRGARTSRVDRRAGLRQRYAARSQPRRRSSNGSRRSRCRSHARCWLARFEDARIPCGPINDYAETFADPQVVARGMIVDVDHPTLGRLRTVGSPIKMSATPPVADRRAPLLGEHTRETLREAGCTESEIEAVMAECGLAAAAQPGHGQ